MTIEPVAGVVADTVPSLSVRQQPGGSELVSYLQGTLARVDGNLQAADGQLRQLAAGEDIAVHEVMITMERARMELMLMTEVRNRLVEAYQELTRMQL